ncbi:hypothetical protein [Labrys monachus]|uniref:AsmA-like C-terminal domain-containing protein n=1 Tax=Labrys monachus TaxID=217067 RepID=A0ABU0FM42_9HYPH|nr:hypothetical protein [Labrys monachus]MDQ0395130.1 hypothetical protein [Labrys monachus]
MKARPHLPRSTGPRPGLRRRAAAVLLAAGLSGVALQPAAAFDGSAPAVTIATGTDTVAGDTRVLTDVRIAYPGAGAPAITIGKLTAKGLKQRGEGFQAGEVTVEKVLVQGGPEGMAVEIPAATLRDVAGPALGAASLSTQASPGHLPPIAILLLQATCGAADIPQVVVHSLAPSAPPLATYTHVALDRLESGKAARLGFDGLDSKSADGAHLTAGQAEIDNLDFGALAAWLDDALAAAAAPQMKPVYSSFELNDVTFADAAGSGSVNRISGRDFELGPPGIKPSQLVDLLGHLGTGGDDASAHPADTVRLVRTLLSAFSLGNLRMDGLVVDEDGKPPLGIGLIRAEALSGSGIGELRFGDISGTTRDENAPFTLGSMALRDLSVTDLDPLLDRVAAGGQPSDLGEDQYPKVRASGFAMADFVAQIPDKGEVRVGGFTIDAPDWVGLLPSTLSIHLGGLSSPLATIDDPESRAVFERLGLKLVEINADIDLAWKEAEQTLTIGPASLDIGDFARFEVGATFGNVPRSVFVSPATSIVSLLGADFRGASLHVVDGGGLGKLIALSASDQKVTVQQLALGSTLLAQSELGALLGDANARTIGEAIQAFIVRPDALTIDVHTRRPLPIAPLLGGAETLGDSDRRTIRDSVTIDTKPE